MKRRIAWAASLSATSLLAGSCATNFGMPGGATQQGRDIFDLWRVFMIAGIAVAAVVYGLLAWSLIRYRRRKADAADALGRPFSANIPLEIVYTAIPIVIVVVLFVLSYRTEHQVDALTPAPDVTLHAQAFAWGWRFSFDAPSPFTVVSDPSGEGVPGPTIELPRGRTVRVVLTSDDVIHAFWVPDFLFKRDAIPGRVTEFDLTPDRDGTYHGACAEFCGLNHAFMTFTVKVVEPAAFESWAASLAAEATGSPSGVAGP
jgi:cytochrome c oxidase subunit 2